jgi:hypothetical protein
VSVTSICIDFDHFSFTLLQKCPSIIFIIVNLISQVWDIRSFLPLHTVKAVNKKGEKALCVAFGNGVIYSGGSDCVVKQFVC